MYIEFEQLDLEGFMSIAELSVNLKSRGITRIDGINDYDNGAQSNGSGKSSILDGIIWILDESTSRGTKEVINNNWKGWVLGGLKFKANKNEYYIRRSRKHPDYGDKLYIEKNGEDISGNTLTKSKEILKNEFPFIDKDLINSILILSQGMPGRFSGLKPKHRKERLEEFSNSMSFVEDTKKKLDKKIKAIDKVVDEDELELNSINSKMEVYRSSLISKKQFLESQVKVESEGLTKAEYEEVQAQMSKLQEELNSVSEELNKVNSQIGIKNSEYQGLSNQMYNSESQISQANNSIAQYERNIDHAKKEIVRLGGEFSTLSNAKCFACNQDIEDQARLDLMTAQITEQIKSHKEAMSSDMQSIQRGNEFVQSTQQAKVGIQSAMDLVNADLESLRTKQEELNAKRSEISLQVKTVNDRLSVGVKTETSYDFIEGEINELEDNIIKSQKDADAISTRLVKNQKTQSILNWLGRQTAREFRTFLLEGVVKYLNDKLDYYGEVIYRKKGMIKMVLKGNDLNLNYDKKPYENLSGGERRRVDLCTQLSLRDLAMNETGLGFNILGADEVFENLDAEGINNMLAMVSTKSTEVDTLLIITHQINLSMPYDSHIVVRKGSDGCSRVVRNTQ